MKRVLPWILLPYLTISQADTTGSKSPVNLLGQVNEEASLTSLDNIEPTLDKTDSNDEPATIQTESVDIEQLTQTIAKRLSELLDTQESSNSQQLSMSLEAIVSSALQDGKQMSEIHDAVTQAMKEVTGQDLQLNPDVLKIEEEMAKQSKQNPVVTVTKTTQVEKTPTLPAISSATPTNSDNKTEQSPSAPISDTGKTTVLPGESLFRVAQRIYGKENGRRFLDLYEANKEVIGDINVVHEGQELIIP